MGVILDDLYDLCIMPPVPADLKAKKINLKEAKAKLLPEPELEINSNENKGLLERIEDSLYDQGLIDLEEEEDDD